MLNAFNLCPMAYEIEYYYYFYFILLRSEYAFARSFICTLQFVRTAIRFVFCYLQHSIDIT